MLLCICRNTKDKGCNMEKVICFHNPEEENGYLSNWYMCKFKIGRRTFSSMEQYMMYSKARLFGDDITASKIMKQHDVAKIKGLGREVSNFDSKIWDDNKTSIITTGLIEKFKQNPELKEKLLGTGDDLLAEMAVKDKIWGTGVSMSSTNRFKPTTWPGQNLLGKCLMVARKQLREDN